jgi:hypothetical protein
MASCPSRIHHQLVSFFVSNRRHHALPNAYAFIRGTALLSNDDVLPTADASTECFEENLLPNGVLLPNSAHMSVSSLYQFLVLTLMHLREPGSSLYFIFINSYIFFSFLIHIFSLSLFSLYSFFISFFIFLFAPLEL